MAIAVMQQQQHPFPSGPHAINGVPNTYFSQAQLQGQHPGAQHHSPFMGVSGPPQHPNQPLSMMPGPAPGPSNGPPQSRTPIQAHMKPGMPVVQGMDPYQQMQRPQQQMNGFGSPSPHQMQMQQQQQQNMMQAQHLPQNEPRAGMPQLQRQLSNPYLVNGRPAQQPAHGPSAGPHMMYNPQMGQHMPTQHMMQHSGAPGFPQPGHPHYVNGMPTAQQYAQMQAQRTPMQGQLQPDMPPQQRLAMQQAIPPDMLRRPPPQATGQLYRQVSPNQQPHQALPPTSTTPGHPAGPQQALTPNSSHFQHGPSPSASAQSHHPSPQGTPFPPDRVYQEAFIVQERQRQQSMQQQQQTQQQQQQLQQQQQQQRARSLSTAGATAGQSTQPALTGMNAPQPGATMGPGSLPPSAASASFPPTTIGIQPGMNRTFSIPSNTGIATLRLLQYNSALMEAMRTGVEGLQRFTNEFFSEKALIRYRFRDSVQSTVKSYEIPVTVLPRFIITMIEAGAGSFLFALDSPTEFQTVMESGGDGKPFNTGHYHMDCANATFITSYTNSGQVVAKGSLQAQLRRTPIAPSRPNQPRPVYTFNMKIEHLEISWDDFAAYHIAKRKTSPTKGPTTALGRSNMGSNTPSQKPATIDMGLSIKVEPQLLADASASLLLHDSPSNLSNQNSPQQYRVNNMHDGLRSSQNIFNSSTQPPQVILPPPANLEDLIGPYGMPEKALEYLELAEAIHQIGDLIDVSSTENIAPTEALNKWTEGIFAELGNPPGHSSSAPPQLSPQKNGTPRAIVTADLGQAHTDPLFREPKSAPVGPQASLQQQMMDALPPSAPTSPQFSLKRKFPPDSSASDVLGSLEAEEAQNSPPMSKKARPNPNKG